MSYMRRGASPGAIRAIRLMNAEIDVRHVLPTIGVPTLVLHRARETWSDGSRFMGEHIPGARMVELPGNDHLPWEGDRDALLDEIERFLSGIRQDAEPDRVLATLVATDVVEPLRRRQTSAGPPGTTCWPGTIASCARSSPASAVTRSTSSGDGVLAMFDGPARAVRCAAAIADGLKTLGLDVRAGVHTGEVEQANGSVHGIAVDVTARIAAAAYPGEVVVSSTVKDIVAGSGIAFEERGEHELDGVPSRWRLFAALA